VGVSNYRFTKRKNRIPTIQKVMAGKRKQTNFSKDRLGKDEQLDCHGKRGKSEAHRRDPPSCPKRTKRRPKSPMGGGREREWAGGD